MDNNTNFNRRRDNDRYSRRNRYKPESSKLAKLLFGINILAILGLIIFLFWNNILPISQRLLVILSLIIIELIILFMIRDKRKTAFNILAFVLIIGITGASAIFINVTSKVNRTISNLNKDQVEVDDKVRNNEPFNLYISGIDTYGDISTVSRSDVNIIATVNPKTGKILLTSVPRDSYLPIPGDGNDQYDKLTHAGNYGVQTSAKTLENALDIEIPYYARINFDSLIKMIDVLGGVDVDNPVAFQSNVSDNYYEKGPLHLDGTRALYYVRERYNLPDGDNDRGRNQERVLAAMIKKVASPGSILKMDEILSVVEDSVNTNISSKKSIELLNSIIERGGNIDITSQDVNGEGARKPSYAMNNAMLYMMIPYEESIKENRENIIETLNGE